MYHIEIVKKKVRPSINVCAKCPRPAWTKKSRKKIKMRQSVQAVHKLLNPDRFLIEPGPSQKDYVCEKDCNQ